MKGLVRRHQTWLIQIAVPRRLQAVVGQQIIARSLKTDSLTAAKRLAPAVIATIRTELAQKAEAAGLPEDSAEQLVQLAKAQRQAVADGVITEDAAQAGYDVAQERYLDSMRRTRVVDDDPASPDYGHPALSEREVRALKRANDILNGTEQESLESAIKRHLAADKPRITAKEYGQKVRRLGDFAKWHGADRAVSTVTKKVAGNYMDVIRASGRAHKTLVKWKSNLQAFGTYCVGHGLLETNPWADLQNALRESTRGGLRQKRRPYTVEEFGTLVDKLSRDAVGSPLLPLTLLSAYSGCRIEELCGLKVEHVTAESLYIAVGKTEAAVRHVPIHPAIAPLVARLTETSDDGYLISGLVPGGPDHHRSHYPSKKFGRYLRSHGFTDTRLVFHSLRKSFSQRAESAGVPESTVDVLTGHVRDSMSYGTYSPAPDFPVLVEAVRKVTYSAAVDEAVKGLAERCAVTEKATRRRR